METIILNIKIEHRFQAMLEQGALDEVRAFEAGGFDWGRLPARCWAPRISAPTCAARSAWRRPPPQPSPPPGSSPSASARGSATRWRTGSRLAPDDARAGGDPVRMAREFRRAAAMRGKPLKRLRFRGLESVWKAAGIRYGCLYGFSVSGASSQPLPSKWSARRKVSATIVNVGFRLPAVGNTELPAT